MHRNTRSTHVVAVIAVSVFLTVPIAGGAAPTGPVATIAGPIAAVNGSSVTIASPDGSRKVVKIQADTLILRRDTATLGAIKAGDALAVTATKGAEGSLTAVSINIF